MKHYSVFGGRLSSELELPDLEIAEPGHATWVLRVSRVSPAELPREPLGTVQVEESVEARLYEISGGYRLEYDDTGIFDVLAGGSQIVWYAAPGVSLESAQVDVLGRVLALALHAAGAYCLHASAVEVGGGAVAFMAPKFHGKSTTAMALVRAGARLITDDTLAILPGSSPRVVPGIQTLRLREDTVEAVNVERGFGAVESKGKLLVGNLAADRLLRESVPLAAVYLLAPVAVSEGASVLRTALPVTRAALSLIGHTKLGPLLGGAELPVVLDRAVALAGRVPVYRLSVMRDFERLPEVVTQLLEWHDLRGALRDTMAGAL